MRLFKLQVLAGLLMASTAAAGSQAATPVVTRAPTRAPTPVPTPLPTVASAAAVAADDSNQHSKRAICILGFCIGVTVTTTNPKPTSTTPPRPTWSYAQPALPARSVSAPASAFTAQAGGFLSSKPVTRYYTLNMEFAAGAPSGFQRRMTVINGQYPAPPIEGVQGDTMVITVNNKLDIPQSIHWHGMRQNYTNSEDGVAGISQCSIQPGKSYTYRFKLDSEVGTYWYHSHYSNTLADGLTGALIIHSRNQAYQKYRDYDDERISYLADWQNDQSETIAHGLNDLTEGYRGTQLPPDIDAILLDGVGQSDCSQCQAGVKCTTTSPPVTRVRTGNKVRFRIINTGAHATIRYSIDNHILTIIEVDDTEVRPIDVHELTIAPGQRMSVIVKMDRGFVGDSFWIRATSASACLNPAYVVTTKGVLWYTDLLGLTWFSSGIPKTNKWADLHDPSTAPCLDTDQELSLTPVFVENSPPTAIQANHLDSAFGQFRHPDGSAFIGFGYNSVAFTNYINNPLLSQIQKGLQLNGDHVASVTFDKPTNAWSAVDLILNNCDPEFLSHPFHIHGRPFHIIARGQGRLTVDQIPSVSIKTNNPIRRDTIVLPGDSWALLRFITDNPGVWPIHCHIGWHLAVGKLGVMVMRPDEVRKFAQPSEWSSMCNGLDVNQIGPAKRSIPPAARAQYDLGEDEEQPRFSGGVQDWTPVPEGVTKGEYLNNGTHWWVTGTAYAGEIPLAEQIPQKRGYLEARTLFMNATHWWIPGTIYVGELDRPINVAEEAKKVEKNPLVQVVTSGQAAPPPGTALVEPASIIGASIIPDTTVTLENTVPADFKPTQVTNPQPQVTVELGPAPCGGCTTAPTS